MSANPFEDPSVTDATAPNPFGSNQNSNKNGSGAYDTSFWQTHNDEQTQSNVNKYNYNNDNNSNINNNINNNNNNNVNNNIVELNNNNNNNNINNVNHNDLDLREENLRRKEMELEERKKRITGLQEEMQSSSYIEDNWPSSCYPVTYHSISNEIPAFARPHIRKMYTLVILTFIALFWNLASELAIYLTNSGNNDNAILWATVYFFAGLFGSWKLWYRQIYYGVRDRKTIKWWLFFIFFVIHIGFCAYMALGIDNDTGGAGFISMINVISKNTPAGLCNLIAAILWTIITLASIFLIKRSWNLYKARGGIEQAQAELTREAVKHAVASQTQNLV